MDKNACVLARRGHLIFRRELVKARTQLARTLSCQKAMQRLHLFLRSSCCEFQSSS